MSPYLATDQHSAYLLLEIFVKKLVGRKDIEEALQRLEKVTVEEARMAAAESLKAIHSIGDKVEDEANGIHDAVKAVEDRVRGVEGMIQDVGDLLQGVDDRVKGIGDMVIIGAQDLLYSSSLFSVFMPLGVEKTGRQIANDPDAMAAESLKTTNESDSKIEIVNNKTRITSNTLQGVWDRARNIDNVEGPVMGIEASRVDGAQVIHNQSSMPPLSDSYA